MDILNLSHPTKRTTLDLRIMDPKRQLEFYTDEASKRFTQCTCESVVARKDFPARFDNLVAGTSHISIVDAPIILIRHTDQQADQSEQRDIQFTYMLQGGVNVRHGEVRRRTAHGGFAVVDDSKAFEFETFDKSERFKALILTLRDEDYPNPEVRRELLNERRFAQHRLVPLLRMTLDQIAHAMSRRDNDLCAKLLPIAESLISIVTHDDEDFKSFPLNNRQAFHLIEIEIESALGNPDLGLEDFARRLRMSKQRIQRIMASKGTTFTDFVREKRMQFGMKQLQSEAFEYKSIAEIAYDCGYSEQSSFHRAFKKMFECTPGEARHEAHNSTEDSVISVNKPILVKL